MYRKSSLLLLIIFSLIILVACNSSNIEKTSTIANPTPKEILSDDKSADIFIVEGSVYMNAEDIDWIMEEELFKGEKVGEIKHQTNDSEKFNDFTASKLPIGTEVYEPVDNHGPIYIIELNGEVIPYLGLIEG